MFYAINKAHAFQNGNKRISAASLMVFLYINEMWLDAGKIEIVEKTLFIAESKTSEKNKVIAEITNWIKSHIVPLKSVENINFNK